ALADHVVQQELQRAGGLRVGRRVPVGEPARRHPPVLLLAAFHPGHDLDHQVLGQLAQVVAGGAGVLPHHGGELGRGGRAALLQQLVEAQAQGVGEALERARVEGSGGEALAFHSVQTYLCKLILAQFSLHRLYRRDAMARLGRAFGFLLSSTALSNLADGVLKVGAPLLAVSYTRSPALVALAGAAATLPWLLL